MRRWMIATLLAATVAQGGVTTRPLGSNAARPPSGGGAGPSADECPCIMDVAPDPTYAWTLAGMKSWTLSCAETPLLFSNFSSGERLNSLSLYCPPLLTFMGTWATPDADPTICRTQYNAPLVTADVPVTPSERGLCQTQMEVYREWYYDTFS